MRVRAIARSNSDYRSSLWSHNFSLTLTTDEPTAPPSPTETPLPVLPRPRGFRHSTGPKFVWNQMTGASAFEIAWKQPDQQEWESLIIGKSQFHYTILGLKPGLLYHVRLRGLADGLVFQPEGAWSGVLTLTLTTPTETPTTTGTPDMALPALPATADLRVVSGSTVAWEPVANAFEYRLSWENLITKKPSSRSAPRPNRNTISLA